MKFTGNRSLLGAIAMVAAGVVLSMMASNYVTQQGADGMTRSRWWWELVLNSQILCAAFIWFTHIDQLKGAGGRHWWVRFLQMMLGFVAVLLPVWLAIAAALLGWFEARPPLSVINRVFLYCIAAWNLTVILVWGLQCRISGRFTWPWYLRRDLRPYFLFIAAPTLVAIGLTVWELSQGGMQHYIYVPFLLYLQGAVPYLARTIRIDGRKTTPVAD